MKRLRLPALVAVAAGWCAVAVAATTDRTFEAAAEVAASSDVVLWQTSAVANLKRGASTFTASVAGGSTEIDYRPVSFDFQGRVGTLRKRTVSAQGTVRHTVNGAVTLLGSAGVREGFTNYRSVWLDEYYRQQYSALTFLTGYRRAHPRGINASVGGRLEYLPGTGFAQVNVAWLSDRVAPGYEIDFGGLRRGADTLNTTALEAVFENVATTRLRTLVTLRAGRTSGREARLGAEAAANFSLSEHWTMRGAVGGTRERPGFTARFAQLALERQVAPRLFLALTGRVYRDTGEIEDAFLFTNAAPALRSRQAGLSLRYEGERVAWRCSYAPLATRSAPTNHNTDFFQHLYRDRDWTLVQTAVSVAF